MSEQPEALRLADALDECRYVDVYRCKQAAAELRRLHAEHEALKQTLHDELDGNLRLRELGGALPTEPMTTFLERVFAENEALRADAERYRWLRDQTTDDGIAIVMKNKHINDSISYPDNINGYIDAAKGRT